jgi:asparagine synthase (glutamine-hydrolysing)
VAAAVRSLVGASHIEQLAQDADSALEGRIQSFGRWTADFGSPVDWHRHPVSGSRWDASRDLTFDIAEASTAGDVKFAWEIARFPHAYRIARAAAFIPARAEEWAAALLQQIESFVAQNPHGRGIHWTSGQEVAFRLLGWLFAHDTLLATSAVAARAERVLAEALVVGASWIEQHLDFSRIAVYNNHLLSEAVALLGVGALLPAAPAGLRWRALGRRILDEEAERQFYADGAYIQQSHNYHRVAVQDLLWACMFARSMGDRPSQSWLAALERSLDFLVAHQNPADGRLPNYGANDGSLPSPLSCCDFSDFRPTLQTISLMVRGERLYPPGPWDEAAAWWLGPLALDAPLANRARRSVSFAATGYHVLRGRAEQGSFATVRCGTLRDRFSQIDMLAVDIWWRGQNVLVDAGSYQYNGPREWHNHFTRTSSHNTVTVDGLDQMVHFRQFKVLYWTEATLLDFKDTPDYALCAGEHHGYERQPGACTHRRSVLFLKDDLWVVVDHVTGDGAHDVRLHWLAGEFANSYETADGRLRLDTPAGEFTVRVSREDGHALEGDVVAGQDEPPRGWLSRYYGEKIAVPSLAMSQQRTLPATFVSVLSGVTHVATVHGRTWTIGTRELTATFDVRDGRITDVRVTR